MTPSCERCAPSLIRRAFHPMRPVAGEAPLFCDSCAPWRPRSVDRAIVRTRESVMPLLVDGEDVGEGRPIMLPGALRAEEPFEWSKARITQPTDESDDEVPSLSSLGSVTPPPPGGDTDIAVLDVLLSGGRLDDTGPVMTVTAEPAPAAPSPWRRPVFALVPLALLAAVAAVVVATSTPAGRSSQGGTRGDEGGEAPRGVTSRGAREPARATAPTLAATLQPLARPSPELAARSTPPIRPPAARATRRAAPAPAPAPTTESAPAAPVEAVVAGGGAAEPGPTSPAPVVASVEPAEAPEAEARDQDAAAAPSDEASALDAALATALTSPATTAEPERQDPDLPRSLPRAVVAAGMRRVTRYVDNCAREHSGTVSVDATILGDTGRVATAAVRGPLSGTAAGACIERAVRRASFPPFGDESLSVRSYAFILQ